MNENFHWSNFKVIYRLGLIDFTIIGRTRFIARWIGSSSYNR